ncbi:MAG: type III pantothenate kinase [Candidatus Omnitrophota bacterium]|jgi:type III pantothenate kinase
MLLAVDIGNTNISFGLFDKNRLVKSWDTPAAGYSLSRLLKYIEGKDISAIFICSVAPKTANRLWADLKRLTGIKPKVIGKEIRVPIKNLYLNKSGLGVDRLINSYAASVIYGAPAIVVSCGTAITLDIVSKNRAYMGGFIQPGLKLSISCLAAKTALLPRIALREPRALIGKDTRACILNGVVLGTSGSIDYLIKRAKEKLKANAAVIGTGGDIDLIKKFSREIRIADKNLTLKGINLIYKARAVPAAAIAILTVVFNLFNGSLFVDSAWPQDPKEPSRAIAAEFEQALKNIDAQKAEERNNLALKCKERFDRAVSGWLARREAQKKSQLNGIIDQNWDKLPYTYNFTNLHFDYFLRGFDYKVLSKEIEETGSLTAPIKAQAIIQEKIYAERYHNPNISSVEPYYFTVTTKITLNMEYQRDDFVITGTESKLLTIENYFPDELKKLRI